MKITNYKKEGNIITFDATGIDLKLLNALRRTIISGVPTMAIEKITFYNNSSILNDEMLAHRIGLVPLTTDLKTYNMTQECTCKGEGCGKCQVTLSLDIKGPGTVYSGQLESKDPKIKPVHEKIPLVKITENQGVKLEATARLGLGREHIKWQPGVASYDDTKKDSIAFMMESFGQHTPEDLLSKAFEVIEDQIKELKKQVG